MKKTFTFTKKDLFLLLILGISILLVDYSFRWYTVYKEFNLNTSIISKYIPEVSLEEHQNYIEENPSGFVYYGIIDDEECRDFENRFKKTVTKYHLGDVIVYLNTKDISNETLYGTYTSAVPEIVLPAIIYYENKEIVDYINYENSELTEKEIIKFIRKYDGI